MIILLLIMLVGFSQQADTGQYSLLKIDFKTNSLKEYNSLAKLIKSTATGDFVAIQKKNCVDNQACPNFKMYDPYGALLQQFSGISSFNRYLNIIDKYIILNNYPTTRENDLQRLSDEEISMKVFEGRRKLAQLQRSQNWEKATLTPRKKLAARHKNAKQTPQKGQNLHQAKKNHLRDEAHEDTTNANMEPQTTKSTENSNNSFPKNQEVEHVLAWKITFIIMTLGLIFGMKYLRHQEERINKMHSNIHPINNQQVQNLGAE